MWRKYLVGNHPISAKYFGYSSFNQTKLMTTMIRWKEESLVFFSSILSLLHFYTFLHLYIYTLCCCFAKFSSVPNFKPWFRKCAPVNEICPLCSIRCSLFWRQQTAKYFLHSVLLFCLKVQKWHGTIRGRHEDMAWVCALWLFCWCFWDLNDFEFWKFYLMVVFVELCPKILQAPQNLPTSPSNIKRVAECMYRY